MSLGRLHKRNAVFAVTAAAFAMTLVSAGEASASGPVSPTGKGTVGGALLGAEVVTITMGAAGLSRGWPYFVFGGLAAVGGGVGGYYLDKATVGTTADNGTITGRKSEPSLYMLAGGMALVIPALVISLNATAYRPPETDRVEPAGNRPSKDLPKVEPPPPVGKAKQVRPSRAYAALPHIPVSLLDVYRGRVSLGLPALEVRPLYAQNELWKYGVSQGTEVRLPVFKAMF